MLLRFGLDRPYCGSASFQTNPRTSDKATVLRNKRGETGRIRRLIELSLANVWFVLRHATLGARRITLHVLATIFLTSRDPAPFRQMETRSPIFANQQRC